MQVTIFFPGIPVLSIKIGRWCLFFLPFFQPSQKVKFLLLFLSLYYLSHTFSQGSIATWFSVGFSEKKNRSRLWWKTALTLRAENEYVMIAKKKMGKKTNLIVLSKKHKSMDSIFDGRYLELVLFYRSAFDNNNLELVISWPISFRLL